MSKSANDLYDGLIDEAGAALRRFFERVDVSHQPEARESLRHLLVYGDMISQFHKLLSDVEVPGWIRHIALIERRLKGETATETSEPANTAAAVESAGMSDAEWFRHALRHIGGNGSTKEIFETQNELAPPNERMKKNKIRYHAMQHHKKGLLIQEKPSSSSSSNYWRFPDTPPRPKPAFKTKRRSAKRAVSRHRNNGHTSAPRKPLPEGYNVNARLYDKLQFIVFSVIRHFAIKNMIVELLNDYEPGRYREISVKQEITDMTRDGLFAKWVFGSDHAYGNPEWANYDEDGGILSIPNEYRPEGHRDPELELQ